MSGYIGLQGRNAASFGYGPKLGVGRYPERVRGAEENALAAAAGGALFRNPASVSYDIRDAIPPELLPLVSQQGAGAVPAAASDGGGNALLGFLPALLAAGAPYAIDQVKKLFNNPQGGAANYDQFASDFAANTTMPGVTPTMSVTDPGVLAQMAPNLGPINDLVPPPQDKGFSGLNDYASDPNRVLQQNTTNNAADFSPTSFGPPDLGGAGLDLGAMDWGVTPGTGAFGLGADIGPITIDPVGILGGALGSWGGGKLASSLVQGDEQQGWASNIGGTVGGLGGGLLASALAGSAFGPVGTLVGAFLGALGAGTLGAGEPDYGYGYTGANVGYGDTGPQLNFWSPNAQNNGSTGGIGDLGNALQQYINQQATAGGYTLNPEMINRGVFSAGRTDAPGGKWFVGGAGVSPADAAYGGAATWRGDNFSGLQDQVWQSLVNNNVYTRGPTTPWADVWAQVSQPQAIWSGGEAGDFITGYTDPSQNVFGSPAMLPGQGGYGAQVFDPTMQVFDPTMYDQSGAA
ncbi:MAG: hypothetical protein KGR68_03745 [Betaproteobacteria bacterium]|nr:hypothetical protein [Betaproteobacteria bacterium]